MWIELIRECGNVPEAVIPPILEDGKARARRRAPTACASANGRPSRNGRRGVITYRRPRSLATTASTFRVVLGEDEPASMGGYRMAHARLRPRGVRVGASAFFASCTNPVFSLPGRDPATPVPLALKLRE